MFVFAGKSGVPPSNELRGSEMIRNFLDHFKNPDAATKPLPIPDPLIMPDRVYPILHLNVLTTHVTAHGVSHIRVRNFTADAVKMQVYKFEISIMQQSYCYYFYFRVTWS